MKIISIVNQKGGVGKTTTTINLGAALSKLGKRVLLIDSDPQRNLSDTLGFVQDNTATTLNELIYFAAYGMPRDYNAFIRHCEGEGVDYIPATPALSSAPTLLAGAPDGNQILAKVVAEIGTLYNYEYCLIDCKPSLDLLTSNALAAADSLLIPVEPEEYAVSGLADLMNTVEQTRTINPRLYLLGILITRADSRRNSVKIVRDELIAAMGDKVLETTIPFLVEASDAPKQHRSCINQRGSRIGELYMEVAREVLKK